MAKLKEAEQMSHEAQVTEIGRLRKLLVDSGIDPTGDGPPTTADGAARQDLVELKTKYDKAVADLDLMRSAASENLSKVAELERKLAEEKATTEKLLNSRDELVAKLEAAEAKAKAALDLPTTEKP